MNLQVRKELLQKERSICAVHGYKVVNKYLGGGATGRVFLAQPTKDKIRSTEKLKLVQKKNETLKVAIKIFYADVGVNRIGGFAKYLPTEVANCNKCFGVPNIVMLLDVFVSCKRIFLVFEYAAKGDLTKTFLEHISTKQSGKRYMEEDIARRYFWQIARGVQQLHRKNIAHRYVLSIPDHVFFSPGHPAISSVALKLKFQLHICTASKDNIRDLKLDNILVFGDDQVKLCDLGFSIAGCDRNEDTGSFVTSSHCGTPNYVAPEVFHDRKHPYDPIKSDMWSLGVILFVLTNGYFPFEGKKSHYVYKQMLSPQNDKLRFRNGLSTECKELIIRLLTSPLKRPNINKIVSDQWLNQNSELLNDSPISPQKLRNIADKLVYRFQAKYVRNYLMQREQLLLDRRRFLLKNGFNAKELRDAGMVIKLPLKDTGGVTVNEVWRFEENEMRKTAEIPDPRDSKHHAKSDKLKDPWAWSPKVEEPTLGIRIVARIIKDSPKLNSLEGILKIECLTTEDFEHTFKFYNTVELGGGRSRRKHKPATCSRHDDEIKLANARRNILGFSCHKKSNNNTSSQKELGKNGSNAALEFSAKDQPHKSDLKKLRKQKERQTNQVKKLKEKKSIEADKISVTAKGGSENPQSKNHNSSKNPTNPTTEIYRPLPKCPSESYELLIDDLQLEHCRPYGPCPTKIKARTPSVHQPKSANVQTNMNDKINSQAKLFKNFARKDMQKLNNIQTRSKLCHDNGQAVDSNHQHSSKSQKLPNAKNIVKEQPLRLFNKRHSPIIGPCVVPLVPATLKHDEFKQKVVQIKEKYPKHPDKESSVLKKHTFDSKCWIPIEIRDNRSDESFAIPNHKTLVDKNAISKSRNVNTVKPQTTKQLEAGLYTANHKILTRKQAAMVALKQEEPCDGNRLTEKQYENQEINSCSKPKKPVPPSRTGRLSAARERRIIKRQSAVHNVSKGRKVLENLENAVLNQIDKSSAENKIINHSEAPKPPKQSKDSSEMLNGRIFQRQNWPKSHQDKEAPKLNTPLLVPIKNAQCSTKSNIINKFKVPTPPKQSKEISAARKRRILQRQTLQKSNQDKEKSTENSQIRVPIEKDESPSTTHINKSKEPTPILVDDISKARKRLMKNRQYAQPCNKTIKTTGETLEVPFLLQKRSSSTVNVDQHIRPITPKIPKEPVPPMEKFSAARKRRITKRRSAQISNNHTQEVAPASNTSDAVKPVNRKNTWVD